MSESTPKRSGNKPIPDKTILYVKLTQSEAQALDHFAAARGLLWGGVPSRSEAIRTLIAEADWRSGDRQ